MNFSDDTIALWGDYLQAQYDQRFLPAFPGKPVGSGQYEYLAQARPGKVYVRMFGQDSASIHEATNRAGVPLNPNLKVWCVYENNDLVIDHADAASLRLLYGNNASVASALFDWWRVQQGPSLLAPLQVYPTGNTGLSITVAPGWFSGLHRFPNGATQTLTLVPTATSGKTAWIMISVDRTTRAIHQTLGADEDAATYTISETTIPDIEPIQYPYNDVPVAAALVATGATRIAQSDLVPLGAFSGVPRAPGFTLTHDLTIPAGVSWAVPGTVNTNGYTLTVLGDLTLLPTGD